MNKSKINVVYIDDNPDDNLIKYLRDNYQNEKIDLKVEQIIFGEDFTYETLLKDTRVKRANIIVIDSWLFENSRVSENKLTGEEFQLILRKEYSFIEVIVISQNKNEYFKTIEKFKGKRGENPIEFYGDKLKKPLNDAVENIIFYRNISEKIRANSNIEKVLAEKIINSLEGINEYDDLKKADIDMVIGIFKDIQQKYEE